MTEPITPDQLPAWVPGRLTFDTDDLDWGGMRLRGWHYAPSDVFVPGMRDYMIVAYGRGVSPMARQCVSRWRNECVAPGNISLLTHCMQAHWRWSQDVEVTHLYLSPDQLTRVAADVFDRDVSDVQLHDLLKAEDGYLCGLVQQLAEEARGPGLGGRLFADAVLNQACVHILRHYADVAFRAPGGVGGGLSPRQRRQLLEYIHANLHRNMALSELAGVAGLSVYAFARRFRAAFGAPPHAFVLDQRIDAARRLLEESELPLKCVADRCGFADQSHMTRSFRRRFDRTPGQCRAARH